MENQFSTGLSLGTFSFNIILYPGEKPLGIQLFTATTESVLGRITIEIELKHFPNLSSNLTRQIRIIIIFFSLFRFVELKIKINTLYMGESDKEIKNQYPCIYICVFGTQNITLSLSIN